jgi:hypothetical protein
MIVPETPVDLPQNQRLTVTVDSAQPLQTPKRPTPAELLEPVKPPISHEDAELMRRAITEAESMGPYRAISGQEFLDAVRKVRISHKDIAAINKAIEEGCEQVDDGG